MRWVADDGAKRDLGALFDAERLGTYSRLGLAAYAMAFAAIIVLSKGLVDPNGNPIGYDFITFWSAGQLTLQGNAAGAFDKATIAAAQLATVPGIDAVYLWHYPPTFQMVAAGLASMPYLAAFIIFSVLGVVAYLAVLRQIVPWREAGLLLLVFPGAFTAVLGGQNSLYSAALMGAGLIFLDKRPIVSGICIGLMAYKPQLAVLFPLVLALTGRWRTFAAAGVTAAAFAALSTMVLGADLWRVFLENSRTVADVMQSGQLPWSKMPSAFVLVSLLGAPSSFAYTVQVAVVVAVTATTAAVWWAAGPSRLAGATLITGTLLLPPYIYDYEMALLAIPLALVAQDMIRRGATLPEKVLLAVAFLAPVAIASVAKATNVQAGFLILLALFVVCVRRALAERRERQADPLDWLTGGMFAPLR